MNQQHSANKTMKIAGNTSNDSAPILNEDQQELSRIPRALRDDPTFMGCRSLGKDGVMRSLTADRDVVDAAAISTKLIKAFLDRMPFDSKTQDDFRGVDGTQVPRKQWFHPDKSILPPPMSQETKKRTRKLLEDQQGSLQQGMEKRMEERAKGEEVGGCSVVVRSNYNLDPKPADDG